MKKEEAVKYAEKHGYILIYAQSSKSSRASGVNNWVVKVPTTILKNNNARSRSVKIMEGSDLPLLLQKAEKYFATLNRKYPIRVWKRSLVNNIPTDEMLAII